MRIFFCNQSNSLVCSGGSTRCQKLFMDANPYRFVTIIVRYCYKILILTAPKARLSVFRNIYGTSRKS